MILIDKDGNAYEALTVENWALAPKDLLTKLNSDEVEKIVAKALMTHALKELLDNNAITIRHEDSINGQVKITAAMVVFKPEVAR